MPPVIVRFKSQRWHWNKKDRRPKTFERRLFEEITKPLYPEMFSKIPSLVEECGVLKNELKVKNVSTLKAKM